MLSDKQLAAIDLLAANRKGVDIEVEVGVSHAQLYRWKQEPEFVARWGEERAQVHEERVEKLWQVGDRALDVALDSLAEGDPTMARDIIKIQILLRQLRESSRRDDPCRARRVGAGNRPASCRRV